MNHFFYNHQALMGVLSYLEKSFLGHLLVSKPLFKVTAKKVIITVFYYLPGTNSSSLMTKQINALGLALTRLLGIEALELRLVRVRYPYLDSSIIAQWLSINSGKYTFTRMQEIMDTTIPLESESTSGLKIKLAGRLTTQRSIPRKTVESYHQGTLSGSKATQCTSKNKLGSFTTTV